jgi:hypothetical protein
MGSGPKVRCKKCNQTIQSKYTHDFVSCSCGAIFVDGGSDYLRLGWSGIGKLEDELEILGPLAEEVPDAPKG